jgi:3-phenylpropionate/trans-cinnamate dioxygenase ferredoxin reductase subunit
VKTSKYIIFGGGMVAGYAARQFAELGLRPGDLTILSADTSIPYERPPLSKTFLAGKDTEESIRINPENFYREHGIEVRLETEVAAVSPTEKRVELSSGEQIGFEKLIVATGSRARTLDVPGSGLDGIYYLRTLRDSVRIRERYASAKRAVVMGGGFIGMEVASVLAQKGVETVMAVREDRIWQRLFTPDMSGFFEGYYTARGVRFAKAAEIAEIRGAGAVSSVALSSGLTLPCDMLVAGIGAVPVTDRLANSGIETGNGVLVNEYLESSRSDIYAAGDVANYRDVLFGGRRRVEHWDNAVSQGQHCARVLLGEVAPFRHVPYFFSDVFDLSYEFWGDPTGAEEVVHRGDIASSSFSVWWTRGQRLVAAFAMKRPEEERDIAPKWIEARQRVSAARLGDTSRPIEDAAELATSV